MLHTFAGTGGGERAKLLGTGGGMRFSKLILALSMSAVLAFGQTHEKADSGGKKEGIKVHGHWKLVTLACVNGDNGLACPTGPQFNVYFGGKLVKSKDVVVVADRLGSVRANSNGERI